jgi:hypothetical protein
VRHEQLCPVYIADRDARAGHRSATGHRSAGTYVGDELHLLVAVRSVTWTNGSVPDGQPSGWRR